MSAFPTRVTASLRDSDMRRLEEVRALPRRDKKLSRTDVFRRVLATEAFIEDALRDGKSILLRDEDGVRELILESTPTFRVRRKTDQTVKALTSKLLKPKDRVLLHLLIIGDKTTWGTAITDEIKLLSGQLYPTIKSLTNDGLITVAEEDEESAIAERRPTRNFCSLTEKGRTLATETMETLEELVVEYQASISPKVVRLT